MTTISPGRYDRYCVCHATAGHPSAASLALSQPFCSLSEAPCHHCPGHCAFVEDTRTSVPELGLERSRVTFSTRLWCSGREKRDEKTPQRTWCEQPFLSHDDRYTQRAVSQGQISCTLMPSFRPGDSVFQHGHRLCIGLDTPLGQTTSSPNSTALLRATFLLTSFSAQIYASFLPP